MNFARAELAPTPLSVPSRTLGAGAIPLLGGAGRELSAFLSLVIGFLETIPAIAPGQIEPPPTTPSETTGAAVASKDKSRDSSDDLYKLNKDTKNNNKKEESADPLPAYLVHEPAAFIMKPPIACEIPTSGFYLAGGDQQATPRGNRNDGGSVQHASIAPNPLAPALPGLRPAAGDVAFALRLTLSGSDSKNELQAVLAGTQPAGGKSAPGPNTELVQAIPSLVARAQGDGWVEQTQWPFSISSPVPIPKNTEDPTAWPSPQSLKQSKESIAAAPRQDSEPGSVAAADPPAHQPDAAAKLNSTLPVIPTNGPRSNPARESGISQPAPKDSKTEPAAKQEFPASHLNDRHVEGNATALEVSVRPPDAALAADTRVARPAIAESPALKVASEPEIKVSIVPPPTRQISLKLSTDDSTRVNVDLTERAGKVLVAVRTSDHELAHSLQTDLGSLVGRLESKGFKTETWTPAAVHQSAAPSAPSNSNTGSGQPQHSGSGQGGGQQRQQQNGSNQRQPARWTAQLEETMSANQARSENQ